MASRRGFQAVGDGTPVMRPADRVPLRDLQNEILEQVSNGSATKAKSSIIDFKKKGLQTPKMASSTRLRMLAPGCTLEAGSSLARARESRLWMGNLESPMPPPQLNSTLINSILTAAAATPCARKTAAVLVAPPAEAVPDVRTGPSHEQLGPKAPADPAGTQTGPLQALGDLLGTQSGPLQEQLRQMGELLLRASENMVPLVERPPVEHHSVFAATSPVQMADHSVNTSGIFERKREPSVAEASTSTDSLLWNLAPESLSEWPRQDLEQRLFSTLIMVEALSQQLASARAHGQGGGPRPSDLRDKVVQTDHTELSQGIYREMYLKAVERIQALELDQDHLRSLLQEMRNSRTAMTTLTAETEEALARVNEMSTIASEDQENISEQMCRIKGLYRKFRETLKRMEEKSQQCIQEKCSMEQQKEEALKTKDAALSVLEEMRTRHTAQIAELERSVGSHMELIPALSNAHKEQVALNEDYVESLQAADELLKDTICDQSKLNEELCKAQFLLQRTRPVLLKLNERAAAALQVCRQQQEETNQMQDELEQSNSRLKDAEQQIGDLTLQLTIANSEMGVLRQRLEELEVERSQAEVRSTELSATLCSTQASYTYLQQVHNAETHRLEELLGQSAQRVEELGVALAERDQQLGQAQRHLQDLQKQLSDTREFNEFLQAENELSREQVAESEVLVKSHLQGLRERNLECEDLKQAQHELQLQKDSLQEELHSTQAKARSMLLEMGEQLAMASTNITLLHHEIYTTTSMLKTSLTSQKPDSSSKERGSQQPAAPPRNAASSFVDTIMVAVTAEDAQISETELEDNQSTALGSGNSAFTRVPTTTPKKDVEDQSDVLEQLSGLGEAVSELVRTVDQLREQKQSRCDELQNTVDSLQGELHTLTFSHKSQVADLKEQVAHLQVQLERDAAALQHKAQEEKTLRKICSDMDETRELVQQQKVENKELRREVFELRRSLQQAQLELQVVREELSSSQSAERMPALEEKIRLQKEIDKLKRSLTETEDSRSRLLERAKRHQLVHETNQRKLERELQVLDQMIETVRKTLSSIPLVVKDCEELQRLVTYLG
ncbi:hypothetical protein AGOR_G00189920 [Albula goreensis]|uniref:Sperm-associated antigen 5 n=1 Tax=Albula goreensis TaxID=1534307 RepID=A0A8T3CTV2_9TELE|nr:hypothetical protein AGOR_G00189920 [Albula goreensis]